MRNDMLNRLAEELRQESKEKNRNNPPELSVVQEILFDLRTLMFPEHYMSDAANGDVHTAIMYSVYYRMKDQLKAAYSYAGVEPDDSLDGICEKFFSCLPRVQSLLRKDLIAGYEGDPAAKSVDEVALTYPGFLAIFVYRIAHELYEMKVPYIPRMMTEFAHTRTGIDINPGAQIGESFFIDHGTGIVVGETTVIGNNVKLYQGVTLGALSTRGGQRLANKKRHPTVEDNVTIYAGATILGGDTVIGRNTVIGGCTFITGSVEPNAIYKNDRVD